MRVKGLSLFGTELQNDFYQTKQSVLSSLDSALGQVSVTVDFIASWRNLPASTPVPLERNKEKLIRFIAGELHNYLLH